MTNEEIMARNNLYLVSAIEWIYDHSDGNYWFADTLYGRIGMSLEEINDYLTAFGIDPEDRASIMKSLAERKHRDRKE